MGAVFKYTALQKFIELLGCTNWYEEHLSEALESVMGISCTDLKSMYLTPQTQPCILRFLHGGEGLLP